VDNDDDEPTGDDVQREGAYHAERPSGHDHESVHERDHRDDGERVLPRAIGNEGETTESLGGEPYPHGSRDDPDYKLHAPRFPRGRPAREYEIRHHLHVTSDSAEMPVAGEFTLRPSVSGLAAYVPGASGDDPSIYKLSSNEVPSPPAPAVLAAISDVAA